MYQGREVSLGAIAAIGVVSLAFLAVRAQAQPHIHGGVEGESPPASEPFQQHHDPEIITNIQVPSDGLFILAAKATDLGNSFWSYEYALQNVNSHRSAGFFHICFDGWLLVKNVELHGVDHHTGEMYDLIDWRANVAEGGVNWSTQSYAANPNANTLRIGAVYNFRFDVNAPPEPALVTIGLFRPGNPPKVWAQTIGPPNCYQGLDTDHDGESDCFDYCPDTPVGTCICHGIGWCCVGSCTAPCFDDVPRDECVDDGLTPDDCGDPRCKNGCPLLDMDNDADRDLSDFAGLQRCFTGPPRNPGYATPSQDCLTRLDVEENHAIDLGDFNQLFLLGLVGR